MNKNLETKDNLIYISAESVSEFHPDISLDLIGNTIQDHLIAFDEYSRVGLEAMISGTHLFLGGEVKTKAEIDYIKIARDIINEHGYNGDEFQIEEYIRPQSPDIDRGVTKKRIEDEGASDQGTIWGYCVNETPEGIPLNFSIANKILLVLKDIRDNEPDVMPYLCSDAKAQCTIAYGEHAPEKVDTIVVSTSHKRFDEDDEKMISKIKDDIINIVMPRVISSYPKHIQELFNSDIRYLINPAGLFLADNSYSYADAGEIGRKTIVNQCGAGTVGYVKGKAVGIMTPNGGGVFPCKTQKVDCSAALISRYICKNAIAANLCDYMSMQLSYAIGFKYPVSVFVNTYGSCKVPGLTDAKIAKIISETFDLSTYGIISTLNLRTPIYKECSTYGWFGRKNEVVHKKFTDKNGNVKEMDVELFTWEKLDAVDKIKEAFGLK